MDIDTAKLLVSALLVFAVAVFSLVSFKMGLSHMIGDLKAVWKTPAVPAAHREDGIVPSNR